MECRGYQAGPNDSPEMGSICSSGSGNSRMHRVGHQQSSTDSDYNSERDRRSRLRLRLLSDEYHKHPNLNSHYHLTTKSHLRRVNMQAPVDHRRSKSLSDLTPLTELPETQTPAKTPAVGGVIKPGTPAYDCPPALGEDNTEQRDEWNCPKGHPALLREISISADNIPALCLNDCPFTPSLLKEGRHPLAQSPNRLRRKGGSFRRGSSRSARSNLKTVKEKTNSDDTDDSNTSSRADSPIKSSLSDDDGIVADVEVCSTSKAKSAPQKTIVPQKELVPHEKTFVETAQALSVVTDFSLQDSSSDVEESEILKTAHQRDIQNTPSSHSPILNRRNDGTTLAQSPNRLRRKGGSFRRVSLRSARSNLKTVKERTSIIETDDTSTSSHADLPIKSDDDIILTDIQEYSDPNNDDRHNYPTLQEPATEQMVEDSDRNAHIRQSTYFSEAETKAEVPFLDHQVLECDCNGKEYTNTEHDITLRIPEGAVAAGEKVHLEVGVAMFGPFNFPTNTQPISPILWLCLLEENAQLKKPFQIILPHYLIGLNEERLMHHQICFAKASHSSFTFEDQQVCYEFNSYNSAPLLFASSGRKSYGIVTINHFCFYCLLAKQTPELARDAGYCLVRIESF